MGIVILAFLFISNYFLSYCSNLLTIGNAFSIQDSLTHVVTQWKYKYESHDQLQITFSEWTILKI